jgi:hypothetical protein
VRIMIKDEFADMEITGEVVAGPVSTRKTAAGTVRPRWFEATLYRRDAGGYVLHQANLSEVWHLDRTADSHVIKPEAVPWGALGAEMVYCGSLPPREGRPQCPPRGGRRGPRGTGPAAVTEAAQHRVIAYPDAAAVIAGVMTARKGGVTSVALSEPMRELLADAEARDPAFREAAGRPVIRM